LSVTQPSSSGSPVVRSTDTNDSKAGTQAIVRPVIVAALVIRRATEAVDQQDRGRRAELLPHDDRRGAVQELVSDVG